jgi:hypothetical protein
MTEQTALSGLASAIAKATIEVGGFVADKRNNEQNYSYISADAVLERGGLALARVGVAVIPAVTNFDIKFTPRANKSDRIDALVNFVMTVCYQDEKLETLWVGCGSDYSTPDKALYKAITSGHKYYLMKLLNISIGNEDSEHEDGEEPKRATPKPAHVSRPETPANAPTFVKDEPQPAQNVPQPTNGNGKHAARPFTPDALRDAITKKAGKHSGATISEGARGLMVGQLNALFDGDENKRHQFTKFLTGYGSTREMPANVCQSFLDWMGADGEMAKREANSVIAYLDGQNGQMTLA